MHLSQATPRTRKVFLQFLDQACAQADALFLCGDIFDAWIGDDLATHDPPPWLQEILQALQNAASCIPVWLGRGNRDFLIGKDLTDAVGATLLSAPVCLETSQGRVLVSHGDEYCTADTGYQRFRRIVRNRWVQGAFLGLSLRQRQRIAAYARRHSMSTQISKTPAIMDVTPDAVTQALRSSGAQAMVHGHTHRPASHELCVDGSSRSRHVLPDWDFDHPPHRGGWAVIDAQGIRLQHMVF